MASSSDTVEQLANREYKYGFVTDIETEAFPKGLNEEIVRMISAKKNEPEFMLEWRLKAYRHWLTMKEPKWANVSYPPIDYQDIYYYSAPKSSAGAAQEPRRGGSRAAQDLREARHSAAGSASCWPAWRWTRCSTAFRWRPPSARNWANWASSSARSREAVQKHPDLVQKYLGSVVPYTDNFFATLNSAVFSDGSLRLHPEGRALPDGAFHLFPHQRRQDGAVRAHADRRRRGRLRQLPRRLHRADARREPAARRRGRTGRA